MKSLSFGCPGVIVQGVIVRGLIVLSPIAGNQQE